MILRPGPEHQTHIPQHRTGTITSDHRIQPIGETTAMWISGPLDTLQIQCGAQGEDQLPAGPSLRRQASFDGSGPCHRKFLRILCPIAHTQKVKESTMHCLQTPKNLWISG